MDIIKELQDWYTFQCNGEWEHESGVEIQSCDNPGWWVKIDLKGTVLENKTFETIFLGPTTNNV